MTQEQKSTNFETQQHIMKVQAFMNEIVSKLLTRASNHDKSKLENPELDIFVEHTKNLANLTYGSNEYNEYLQNLKPALQHHYANNNHHPEHHKNGIIDMTLLDMIEMFVDWKAASLRHNNGNIKKSIEINGTRFDMNQQLVKIFENTVKEMSW
jgi:hypothetical protein